MTIQFYSKFAKHLTELIEQRDLLGYTDKYLVYRLKNFDTFCLKNYPNDSQLTKDIAFAWCEEAKNNGGSIRSLVIRIFGKFLYSIGEGAFILPPMFFPYKRRNIPFIISDNELKNFFEATDRFPNKNKKSPLLQYTIPVIFRLQYACGLRPKEVRMLHTIDFDFKNRTIYIVDYKHYRDRKLTLSDYIFNLCNKYNQIAKDIIPNRQYFFQSPKGEAYSKSWLARSFKTCWDMSGNTRKKCTSYSLRHRYATELLMQWVEEKKDLDVWIPYLSAYMGHAKFTSTYYYIHLLPERVAKISYTQPNNIIPRGLDYEKNL
jgi:integrase